MNAKPVITLYAPADHASHVCVEGEMVAIKDGKVEVVGEQVNILIAHGFTTEPPADVELTNTPDGDPKPVKTDTAKAKGGK